MFRGFGLRLAPGPLHKTVGEARPPLGLTIGALPYRDGLLYGLIVYRTLSKNISVNYPRAHEGEKACALCARLLAGVVIRRRSAHTDLGREPMCVIGIGRGIV